MVVVRDGRFKIVDGKRRQNDVVGKVFVLFFSLLQ
jgi:hypothetical protein